jgi:methionine-S-sulfoxide reductase
MRTTVATLVALLTGATTWTEPPADKAGKVETAVFAGGCFWCTELAFEQIKGVMSVESGYCGGTRTTASYGRVHEGTTRHAEAIRVTYNRTRLSYEQLLDVFFDAHDPTQLNQQGEDDVGRQYRSAIFFANDEQKKGAETKINELQRNKVFARRIVTRLERLDAFYPAEDVHQNFARKYPFLPYIQSHAIPKACHVRMMHPELVGQGR